MNYLNQMIYFNMDELYKELQERMKVLENKKQSDITEGRIAELQLIIVRIQQILFTK